MADWILLSQDEAAAMFKEALGALAVENCYSAIAQTIYEHTNDGRPPEPNPLTLTQLNVVNRGFYEEVVAAQGLFAFVYPYERYKKVVNRYPDRHLDPSAAFDFATYSRRDVFQAAFPSTVIHTWNPGPRDTWFADCVRNSFAHAQSTTVIEASQLMVSMVNAPDGLDPNFEISMPPRDFERLVKSGLQNFVHTVVDGGIYEPLSTLLQWDLNP